MKAPIEPPIISTVEQARALGMALRRVVYFDDTWAERVFQGDARLTMLTGPKVLNSEIASMWRDYWTEDEKLRIYSLYVAETLG